MISTKIADAYLPGGASVAIRTLPGRTLAFVGGHAEIVRAEDLPAILRMEQATVEFSHEYRDWVPDYLNACGWDKPVKAKYTIGEPVVPPDAEPGPEGLPLLHGSDTGQSEELSEEMVGETSSVASTSSMELDSGAAAGDVRSSDRTDVPAQVELRGYLRHKVGCQCRPCLKHRPVELVPA